MKRLVREKERARTDGLRVANNKVQFGARIASFAESFKMVFL